MSLTKDEVLRALRISRALQGYFDKTGETNLRSTDVYPLLERKELIEADRHNGIHLRKFLKKLADNNELKNLIPQCTHIPSASNEFNQWHFHPAKEQMPRVVILKNSNEDKRERIDLETARKNIRLLIEGIDPVTLKKIDDNSLINNNEVRESMRMLLENTESKTEECATMTELTSKEISKTSGDNDLWVTEIKTEIAGWKFTRPDSLLRPHQLDIRKNYPRAFENWRKRETEILAEARKRLGDPYKIGQLLGRQPSAVETKLKEIKAQ